MTPDPSSPVNQAAFKDGAINYLTRLYSPRRCQFCIDGTAELADISVADAWTRDQNGEYLFDSRSLILVRNEIGRKMIQDAKAAGVIEVSAIDSDTVYRTHKSLQKQKKAENPARIERLKNRIDVPDYFWVPDISAGDKFSERINSFILALGKIKIIRYIVLKLLLSRMAVPFIWFRQKRKRRRQQFAGAG